MSSKPTKCSTDTAESPAETTQAQAQDHEVHPIEAVVEPEAMTTKKRKRTASILEFFECSATNSQLRKQQPEKCQSEHSPDITSKIDELTDLPLQGPFDIGAVKTQLLLGKMSDDDKFKILQNLDQPVNYKFPTVIQGKQQRRFQSSWFCKYSWLTYSRLENGGYCACCVAFASSLPMSGTLGALVHIPLANFKKALEILETHEKTQYHKNAYSMMVNFLEVMSRKRKSIATQLDTAHSAQKEKNRKVLKSIMATLEVCGRQGIAIRGHRDDSKYLEDTENNPGNFQTLLKFRCDSGDTALSEHLASCNKNSSYRSKTTQNEIINILGDMITESIVQQVHEAKFFSVISDEVQDAASIEQITFVLRYIQKEDNTYVVKETFVGFKEQHREMTGNAIASSILDKLAHLGLDCSNLRGQGYDGSGSMAGVRKGASSIILEKYPLATYIHCCSHILNLAVASSCSEALVRNMMGSVSEVSKFFEHGKRQDKLNEVIESEYSDFKKKRVKGLCRTRWVERHDALEVFIELYPAIVQVLYDIANREDSVSWNKDTTTDANGLLASIEKFSFLVTLVVVFNVLSYIKGLTVLLQQRSLDIVEGVEMIQDVQESLEEVREDINEWHQAWFQMAVDAAKDADTEMPSIPRRCKRQKHRDNVEAEQPDVYYRRALTIPFLDHLIQELKDRFSANAKVATLGLCLVPSAMFQKDDWLDRAKELATLYHNDLPSPLTLTTELHCWKMKFGRSNSNDLPDSPISALNNCDKRLFPNVFTLLQILATIPVTSCEAERTFSALRRIKPFLRTTMKEDRLNGLALLHIHRNIDIDLNEAVERFARKQPRKLLFL